MLLSYAKLGSKIQNPKIFKIPSCKFKNNASGVYQHQTRVLYSMVTFLEISGTSCEQAFLFLSKVRLFHSFPLNCMSFSKFLPSTHKYVCFLFFFWPKLHSTYKYVPFLLFFWPKLRKIVNAGSISNKIDQLFSKPRYFCT